MESFLKFPIGRLFGPLLLAGLFFYFGFHVLNGERGLFALLKEQRKLDLTNTELERTKQARNELDHRVRLLNSASLDLDLLDEQARSMLGLSAADEDVIILER